MAVKGEIVTREDMNGEFSPTANTEILLNYKQIPKNYVQEVSSIAQEQEKYYAEGYPRSFLDNINEDTEDLKVDCDTASIVSSGDFTVNGLWQTSTYKNSLFESSTTAGRLSLCTVTSDNDLTADTGSDRSISLFFKLASSDLTGTASIFTQRISSDRGYHIGLIDGKLYTRAYDSSGNYVWNTWITSEVLNTTSYYHVILTHDATNLRVFLNGVKRLDFTISGTVDHLRPYAFGYMLGTSNYRFYGWVRSLCVFTTDWTDEQAIAFGQTYYNNFNGVPSSASINTDGTWGIDYSMTLGYSNDRVLYSNTTGDYFELTYYGNKIEPYVRKYSGAGLVNVYIDDVFIEQVDMYAISDSIELLGTYEQTTKTYHTIKLELETTTSEYILIDYFTIYDVNYIVGIHGNELHLDQLVDYFPYDYSVPHGFSRFELDNVSEIGRTYQRYNNGYDSDAYLYRGSKIAKSNSLLFDWNTNVLDFSDGGTCTFDTPSSDGSAQRCFACWFKPTATDLASGSHAVCGQRVSGNHGYYFGVQASSGGIYVRCYDISQNLIILYDPSPADAVLVANQWYFFCLVHDSSNYEIYLNGGLLYNGTYSGTIDYTTNGFKLGTATSSNLYQFYGQVGAFWLDYMSATYWTPATILNIYENSFETVKLLPDGLKFIAGEDMDWDFEQEAGSVGYKFLMLGNLNDSITMSFTGSYIGIYGTKDTDGGTAEIYLDGVYDSTINLYDTSRSDNNLLWYWYRDDGMPQTIQIQINNVSGGEIRISSFFLSEGYNILYDESGKKNNCVLQDLSDTYSSEFRDNILGSKYEFKMTSDNSDYPVQTKTLLNEDVYSLIGDKFFLGGVISPVASTSKEQFVLYGHYPSSGNELIRINFIQDPVTLLTDYVDLDGDFINETANFGAYLDTDHYYFIGVLVDDDVDETWLIVFDLTDSVVIYQNTYSFITSTTYPRDNFDEAYINYGYGTGYGTGEIDSFIFEPNTEETTTTILEKLYTLSYATGADQDTPTDVLTVYSTEPKLTLRKESETAYVSSGIYYSKVLHTGELEGSGKLNITKDIPTGASITNIQTRTSDDVITDSPTWSSWEDVSDIGIIASPNREYIQIRFTMTATSDLSKSPSVTAIQVIDVDPVPWERKAFSYPITYTLEGVKEFVISDATNVHQVIELNGANFVTFDVPYPSDSTQYLTPEKSIRLFDDFYIARKITTTKSGGKSIVNVYAEALFYNLSKRVILKPHAFWNCDPSSIISGILENTGWEFYQTDIAVYRDFQFESGVNVLEQLREVQNMFGGDLIFDNQKRQVSLKNIYTEDNGVIFAYKKNMENITKEVDTTNLANRIYVYGEDELSIEEENNGVAYVENDISSYVPEGTIFEKVVTNTYFTDADQLLDYAEFIRHDYEEPEVTYNLQAKDFSVLENLDLSYNVGDTITVFDEELDLQLETRIVAVDYNILVPQESEITLSSQLRNLGDEISELKKYQDKLKKLNYYTLFNLIKWYLQDRIRLYGWISADYVTTSGIVAVGSSGTVTLQNVKSWLSIRTGAGWTYSIVGRLLHGDSIVITEISDDENWYKINYSV